MVERNFPSDRLEWHVAMKAREKEEVPKLAAIVALTAARSIIKENAPTNDKVGKVIPSLGTICRSV